MPPSTGKRASATSFVAAGKSARRSPAICAGWLAVAGLVALWAFFGRNAGDIAPNGLASTSPGAGSAVQTVLSRRDNDSRSSRQDASDATTIDANGENQPTADSNRAAATPLVRQLTLGESLLAQQKYRLAAEVLRQVVAATPGNARGWRTYGQAKLEMHWIDAALDCYRRSLEIDPDQPAVANDLAWHLATDDQVSRRDANRAVELANHACRATGFQQPAYVDTLVMAYAAAGRWDEANATARRASTLLSLKAHTVESKQAPAADRFGMLANRTDGEAGAVGEALVHFSIRWRASERWPFVLERLAWLLATHPQPLLVNADQAVVLAEAALAGESNLRPQSFDTLAAAQASAGRHAEACQSASKALALAQELRPGSYDVDGLKQRLRQYQAGQAYRREAPDDVRLSATSDGSEGRVANIFHELASLLKDSGEHELAPAAHYVAVFLDPNHRPARLALGQLLAHQGYAERAREQFEAALRLGEPEAQLCAELADVCSYLGDYPQAIVFYEQALALRPEQHAWANVLARLLASVEDLSLRRPERAIVLARQACEAVRQVRHDYLDTLSMALASAGRFGEASETIRRAIRLVSDGQRGAELENPRNFGQSGEGARKRSAYYERKLRLYAAGKTYDGDPLVHQHLGELLAADGELAAAAEHFSAVLIISPDNVETMVALGNLRTRQGRHDEALALYRGALSRRGNLPQVANDAAWILATHPNPTRRAPSAAMRLAEQACRKAQRKSAAFLDTLSVAQAAAGRFEEAITTINEAIGLVENGASEHRQRRLKQYAERRKRYQAGQPWLPQGPPKLQPEHVAWLRRAAPQDDAIPAIVRDVLGELDELPNAYAWAGELAWIMAAEPDARLRDSALALTIAETIYQAVGSRRAELLDLLAAAQAASGRFDAAVKTAETALARLGARDDELRQQMLSRLALYREECPYFRPAIESLSVHRLPPTSRAGRLALALCLLGKRLGDEHRSAAIAIHRQALRLAPRNPLAHRALGRLLLAEGDLQQAIEHLGFANLVAPDDLQTLVDLGRASVGAARLTQAADCYLRALALDATRTDVANDLAWLLAVQADATLRDPDRAVRIIERACARSEPPPQLLDTLAAAYAAARRYDDATATIERALASLPDRGQNAIRDRLLKRRELYASGKPYFEDLGMMQK